MNETTANEVAGLRTMATREPSSNANCAPSGPPSLPRAASGDLQLSYYFVAVLDALGQDALLRSGVINPDRDPDYSELVAHVKKTFGVVAAVHDCFAEIIDIMRAYQHNAPGLRADQLAEFQELSRSDIEFQSFCDTTIIFLGLRNIRVPSVGVMNALYACAIVFLRMLANGHPLRGGIEVALAGELPRIGLYGPALAWAHHLESHVADYPRIVVGPGLIEFLHMARANEEGSTRARANQFFSNTCLALLAEEADGTRFLDYLGTECQRCLRDLSEEVSKAQKFVMSERDKWARLGNHKLRMRYEKVEEYFETRAGVWRGTIKWRQNGEGKS